MSKINFNAPAKFAIKGNNSITEDLGLPCDSNGKYAGWNEICAAIHAAIITTDDDSEALKTVIGDIKKCCGGTSEPITQGEILIGIGAMKLGMRIQQLRHEYDGCEEECELSAAPTVGSCNLNDPAKENHSAEALTEVFGLPPMEDSCMLDDIMKAYVSTKRTSEAMMQALSNQFKRFGANTVVTKRDILSVLVGASVLNINENIVEEGPESIIMKMLRGQKES